MFNHPRRNWGGEIPTRIPLPSMRDKSSTPDDFANAYKSALAALRDATHAACAREAEWPDRVAAAVHAALGFAATDPAAARLLVIDAWAQGREGALFHQRMIEAFVRLLGAGAPPDVSRPELAEEFMVNCVVAIAVERLLAGEERELPTLAPQLVELILLPYLGAEEARVQAMRYRH